MAYSPRSRKESDMTEQLHFIVHNNFFFFLSRLMSPQSSHIFGLGYLDFPRT